MIQLRLGGLWQNPNFLKLWGGETISLFGSAITTLALPFTAIVMLKVSASELGVLSAAGFVPFLLVSLFAGIWVDRLRRRPILIVANLGRATLIGLIPALALLGALRIEHLITVSFLVGTFTVFFDVAYQSYFPSLVGREHLVEGNSKLQISSSAAEIAGPGLAGVLIDLVTAPFALVIDALSFLVSVGSLASIHATEPAPQAPPSRVDLRHEIVEGLRITYTNPILRAFACEAATFNLFMRLIDTVFLLYALRALGLGASIVGVIIGAASVGFLAGSLVAEPTARRFGIGPAIMGGTIVACAAPFLIPLAGGPLPFIIMMLALSQFLTGVGVAISNVHIVSLRQDVTPDRYLGRMTASYRFLVSGAIPFGALLGGALGDTIGLRPTLLVGACGLLGATLWLFFSPVPRITRLDRLRDDVGSASKAPEVDAPARI